LCAKRQRAPIRGDAARRHSNGPCLRRPRSTSSIPCRGSLVRASARRLLKVLKPRSLKVRASNLDRPQNATIIAAEGRTRRHGGFCALCFSRGGIGQLDLCVPKTSSVLIT